MSTLGLRDRNKAKRRNAILDAALDLFDRPEGVALTTERIAQVAEVSVATVYNLVGTREQLLLALIDRLIADLVASMGTKTPQEDPLAAMRELIVRSVDALTSRPVAFRQIVLQLTAAANTDLHTKLSPAAAGSMALRRAQELRIIRDDLDAEALSLQVYLSYNGALLRWAAGALTDAGFRAAAVHGLTVVVAASATTRARSRVLEELRVLGAELVR